jgi:molybdate transport system substrate-binding protein
MKTIKHSSSIIFIILGIIFAPQSSAHEDLILFSASSIAPAFEVIVEKFEARQDVKIRISAASSSTLARQIKSGAPAHIFISANQMWLSYLWDECALFLDATTIATNSLVLAVHKSLEANTVQNVQAYFEGFEGRLAIAEPSNVPLGIYTKEALTYLGLWDKILSQVAPARNSHSALKFIESGAVKLGIIYKSDAFMSNRVYVLYDFPTASHNPISYKIAKTKNPHPLSDKFIAFLSSTEARDIIIEYGFGRVE